MAAVEINTFVFFDMETTGLPEHENNRTKPTELGFLACSRESLLATDMGEKPRVQSKLIIPLNPEMNISDGGAAISKLSNDLLKDESPFSQETAKLINSFLHHLKQPICLVAHNGFYFDFPILQKSLFEVGETLPTELLCMDSLAAFRQIEAISPSHMKAEPRPFQLSSIYRRFYNAKKVDAHHAESDVILLMMCAIAKSGCFVKYAQANSVLFSSIAKLTPVE